MPIEANYKTYYAIHLNHWSETWGGVTYNKLLVKDFPDSNLVSTATTKASSIDFLYPRLVENKYILDGLAEGHFTLYNDNASTVTTVTAYTVSVKKTDDVPSNETILGSYTKNISSDNSVATRSYLTLPIYMTTSNTPKISVDANEKLILHIEFTGGSDLCISHANDSDNIDIEIKLPYAPTG